jgi:hypothetical protein
MIVRFVRLRLVPLLSLAAVLLSVTACALLGLGNDDESTYPVSIAYDPQNPVVRLPTDKGRLRVTVTGLSGNSIYLVKTNGSAYDAPSGSTGMIDESSVTRSVARSADDAKAAGFALAGTSPAAGSVSIGGVTRRDHERAARFRVSDDNRSRGALQLSVAEQLAKPKDADGTYDVSAIGTATKKFYVDDGGTGSAQKWVSFEAVLRGMGEHCRVWVAKENYNASGGEGISSGLVARTVANFDALYYPETALLGYEYGGGVPSTDPTAGGADGEELVNILIYDIGFDYAGFETQDSGVVGYFWAKDLFPQDGDPAPLVGTSVDEQMISNVGELFYIDAHFLNAYENIAYSTLAHEFQHMINFYQKNARLDIAGDVPVWYNEMLSLMAEDVLAGIVGIESVYDDAHPAARMTTFNQTYGVTGLTYWDYANPLPSYAYAYAFGAYLARNYGGARLLKDLLANDAVGIPSISKALSSTGSTLDFSSAFRKFGEALVLRRSDPTDESTFDRTPPILDLPLPDGSSFSYRFNPLYIWGYIYQVDGTTYHGPWISKSSQYGMKQYGVLVESVYELLEAWVSVSFDVIPPSDPDVSMDLMIEGGY